MAVLSYILLLQVAFSDEPTITVQEKLYANCKKAAKKEIYAWMYEENSKIPSKNYFVRSYFGPWNKLFTHYCRYDESN